MSANFLGLLGTQNYVQTGTGVSVQAYGAQGTNEVQVVGYASTGASPVASGSFTLSFNGQTTAPIPYDAQPGAVQAALEALSMIGAGNVLVSGPSGANIAATGAAIYKITFLGAMAAQPQPQITIQSANPGGLQDGAGQTAGIDLLAWTKVDGAAEVDAVQKVVVTGNATFQLSYLGNSTPNLAVGATAAQVKAALEALPGIDQVAVTGAGTAADPYLITFQAGLGGGSVALLTGGSTAAADTILSSYDAASQLTGASDAFSHYAYDYDGQGRVKSVDNAGTPNVPSVVLTSQYDTLGNRTALAATIAGVNDFVNAYSYDARSRLTQATQDAPASGNAVAPKGLQFDYNSLSQMTAIRRYTFLQTGPDQTSDPARTTLVYNAQGQLTDINSVHNVTTTLDHLSWTYDTLGRVASFSSSVDGSATYGYDQTNQVTSGAYTTNAGATQPGNEGYSYDANGNRTNAGYSTGTNNRLLSDGTFTYSYDDEGNRVSRTRISAAPAGDYLTTYAWDYRNRLTDVREYDNSSVLTKHVHYVYDVFDHLIGRQLDSTGSGAFDQTARYVYDGTDVVLQFDGAGSLTNRYLSAPGASGVDVVMAEEAVTSLASPGTVTWPLTDNLGSVRDVVDAGGNVIDHLVYNSFGQVAGETNASVHHLQGYAGGIFDPATGLVNFWHRWYDPAAGRWISEDPIGFGGGDANLSRYVGNDGTNEADPSGLRPANWFSDYVYVVGPQSVPSPAGKACFTVYVHYVTSWFTTDFGEENDHLIAQKTICFCKANALKAFLMLSDWAESLSDTLNAMSTQRALEHATDALKRIEAALMAKLVAGDFTESESCPAPAENESCPAPGEKPRTITPYRDPARPDYNNGATHMDHAQARALDGPDEPSNIRPLPAETNMRKGGDEGALKEYEQYLIRNGMSPKDARSVIQPEIDGLKVSPRPRPMDPRILDQLPANPLDQGCPH